VSLSGDPYGMNLANRSPAPNLLQPLNHDSQLSLH
jgi:hypothetical protein